MKRERPLACPIPNEPVCLPSLRHLILTFHNMADAYFDTETIPLSTVMGGRIELDKLIEELDAMYPDQYPDHEMNAWQTGRMAGAIEIIRFLKSKRNP
jgi:hypothetical protein